MGSDTLYLDLLPFDEFDIIHQSGSEMLTSVINLYPN